MNVVLITLAIISADGFVRKPIGGAFDGGGVKRTLDYAAARKGFLADGKPLVVLLCASWCAPCQSLKAKIARLDTSAVHFCLVDVDRDPLTASRIRSSKLIPEIVIYSNQGKARRLIGDRSMNELRRIFIR